MTVPAIVSEHVGFFEESQGTRSMTRLCALLLVGACLILASTVPVVALKRPENAPAIIGAIAAAIGSLAGGVWGALRERN